MKARSPLLGYNHNIRYGGRLYHVQTEDSGVQNPRIFTHVFFEGTIIASKRTEYAAASDETAVQKMMQTQHKGMLRALRDGFFDSRIAAFFGEPLPQQRAGAAPAASGPASSTAGSTPDAASPSFDVPVDDIATSPVPAAAATAHEMQAGEVTGQAAPAVPAAASVAAASRPAFSHTATAREASPDAGPPPRPPPSDPPVEPIVELTRPTLVPPGRPGRPASVPPSAPAVGGSRQGAAPPVRRPPPIPLEARPPATPRSVFDLPLPSSSSRSQLPQLHPTPARVSAVVGVGRGPNPAASRMAVVAGPGSAAASRGPMPPVAAPAPSTPARLGAAARPDPAAETIFGEDPYSDKSLDEVILAYLAEDPPGK